MFGGNCGFSLCMDMIGTIVLSKASEIIFYIDDYKGCEFANIRKFVKSTKYTGPTKSGVKLDKKQLEAICGILTQASVCLEDSKDVELGEVPLSESWFIRVGFTYFNGQYGLDIRQYLKTEKYTGPSKKGVRIPFDCFDATVSYCEQMLEFIKNPQKKEMLSEKQEEAYSQKSEGHKEKSVDGVPNDYQKYFS